MFRERFEAFTEGRELVEWAKWVRILGIVFSCVAGGILMGIGGMSAFWGVLTGIVGSALSVIGAKVMTAVGYILQNTTRLADNRSRVGIGGHYRFGRPSMSHRDLLMGYGFDDDEDDDEDEEDDDDGGSAFRKLLKLREVEDVEDEDGEDKKEEPDTETRLAILDSLHEDGTLSEEEYAKKLRDMCHEDVSREKLINMANEIEKGCEDYKMRVLLYKMLIRFGKEEQ